MASMKTWQPGDTLYGWHMLGGEEPPPATPAQREMQDRIAAGFTRQAAELRAAHDALLQGEPTGSPTHG